jgi:hypothetical protein
VKVEALKKLVQEGKKPLVKVTGYIGYDCFGIHLQVRRNTVSAKNDALDRGGWEMDGRWTMPAYRREVNGYKQVVMMSPNRLVWQLVQDGEIVYSLKSIFLVLREANLRSVR